MRIRPLPAVALGSALGLALGGASYAAVVSHAPTVRPASATTGTSLVPAADTQPEESCSAGEVRSGDECVSTVVTTVTTTTTPPAVTHDASDDQGADATETHTSSTTHRPRPSSTSSATHETEDQGAQAEPGDDHSEQPEPGDDHSEQPEPGDH